MKEELNITEESIMRRKLGTLLMRMNPNRIPLQAYEQSNWKEGLGMGREGKGGNPFFLES